MCKYSKMYLYTYNIQYILNIFMFTNIDKMFMINRYRNLLGFQMLGDFFFEWSFQVYHSPSGIDGQESLSSFSVMPGG